MGVGEEVGGVGEAGGGCLPRSRLRGVGAWSTGMVARSGVGVGREAVGELVLHRGEGAMVSVETGGASVGLEKVLTTSLRDGDIG